MNPVKNSDERRTSKLSWATGVLLYLCLLAPALWLSVVGLLLGVLTF